MAQKLRNIIYVFALMGAVPASAQSVTVFTPMSGSESYVCADLNDGRATGEIKQWLLGYWSGVNVGAGAAGDTNFKVGKSITANGVFGEIKLYCTGHPSSHIIEAAFQVYLKFKSLGK